MLKYCMHFQTWAAYVVCFVIVCLCNAEAQDAYSEGGSPHKSIVSDDADELYGDSIDEDTQSVKPPVDTAPAPSTSGELHCAFSKDVLLCPTKSMVPNTLFIYLSAIMMGSS
jgi:hypothetical protein